MLQREEDSVADVLKSLNVPATWGTKGITAEPEGTSPDNSEKGKETTKKKHPIREMSISSGLFKFGGSRNPPVASNTQVAQRMESRRILDKLTKAYKV